MHNALKILSKKVFLQQLRTQIAYFVEQDGSVSVYEGRINHFTVHLFALFHIFDGNSFGKMIQWAKQSN